jgi:hypothetical protein
MLEAKRKRSNIDARDAIDAVFGPGAICNLFWGERVTDWAKELGGPGVTTILSRMSEFISATRAVGNI